MTLIFSNAKSKKFFILFVIVMGLNSALAVVLLRTTFSQTQRPDYSLQQPVKVEVLDQKDCPLRVSVDYVDNSALSFQNINFSLQNISTKSVRAYTLLGDGKRSGKVVTNFFFTTLFHTLEINTNSFAVERQNITEDETVLLSVDYVEFADGSSWGGDTQAKSIEIAGQRDGVKAAIRRAKNALMNQDANTTDGMIGLLNQDIKEITVDIPPTGQPDEWKKGFQSGFKAVISVLQKIKEQGTENLIKKLVEMEAIAN
jgi:hypothetical protein